MKPKETIDPNAKLQAIARRLNGGAVNTSIKDYTQG